MVEEKVETIEKLKNKKVKNNKHIKTKTNYLLYNKI
jgi:hypothetical protein